MNGKNISDAFEKVDMAFIAESDPYAASHKKRFPKWALPVAASFVVLVALSLIFARGKISGKKPPVVSAEKSTIAEQTTDYNEENTSASDETTGKTDGDTENNSGKSNNNNFLNSNRNTSEKTDKNGATTTKKSGDSKTSNTEKQSQEDKTVPSIVPVEPITKPDSGNYTPDVLTESEEYLNAIEPYAISRHQYPSYPLHYAFDDGSDKDSSTRYEEWRQGNQYKMQFLDMWQPASEFIKNSTPVFLSADKGKNVVYSPANVYFAFSLLAETTGGNSRQQILSALNESNISDLRTRANGIWNFNYSNDGATKCLMGNSIWLNNKFSYKKDTLDILASNYYASSFSGDMSSAGYNNAFRQWMNYHTDNLLENQISKLAFQPDTDFTLASTILYKAKWSEPFSVNSTSKQDFKTPKKTVSVDFMHKRCMNKELYYGDNFTSVFFHFDEGGSMTFILPDKGLTPESLLSDSETLQYIVTKCYHWSKSQKYTINCSIPKFDVTSQLDLKSGMKKLGITDCFDSSKADFSPICEQNMGALTEVTHGARVMIDEEGVTATAYTVSTKSGSALTEQPEFDFTLDRPFLFVIKSSDGLPLFVGIVNNP